MAATPLLDAAYEPHEWVLAGSQSMATPEGQELPPLASGGRLNVFSTDSEYAQRTEERLERGGSLSSDTFLFDVEVLHADETLPLTSGGHAYRLGEDEAGLPAGTLVMEVYRRVEGVTPTMVETLRFISMPQ